MAYGFGSTLGTGTTDRLLAPSLAYDTFSTYSVWAYRNGAGGANFGTIFQDPGPRRILRNSDAAGVMQVQIQYDSTTGVWTFPRPGTGVWAHFLITHVGDATNAPVCYLNGTSQTVTQTTAPAGSLVTTATAMSFGNRASDNAVVWDGMLAELARWNRVLSAGEIDALADGVPPSDIARGLVQYFPGVRGLASPLSAPWTTNGTPVVQPHPRIIPPRRVGFMRLAPPPGAPSTLVTAGRPPWRGAWRGVLRGTR